MILACHCAITLEYPTVLVCFILWWSNVQHFSSHVFYSQPPC